MSDAAAIPCSQCKSAPAITEDDGCWTVRCETHDCPNQIYQATNCDRAIAIRWWNEELAAALVPA